MDHKIDIVREFKPDDLQEVPGSVGSDCEHLGWIGVGVEIDENEGMVDGVADGVVVDSVLMGGVVYLHITIS
ncbi:hypothetical protein MNBD_ACTINO01-1010 [hydrothermal vent metagenome]|uniref:Uncharacterized protein n=1 Tax=hydrothermal vent metagenome TaxID=652676 RepID=A0A3B0RP06_9ZZZZ